MSTLSETRPNLDIDVEVVIGGTWYPGTLEHWRDGGVRKAGFVRYTTGHGDVRSGWFDVALISKV